MAPDGKVASEHDDFEDHAASAASGSARSIAKTTARRREDGHGDHPKPVGSDLVDRNRAESVLRRGIPASLTLSLHVV